MSQHLYTQLDVQWIWDSTYHYSSTSTCLILLAVWLYFSSFCWCHFFCWLCQLQTSTTMKQPDKHVFLFISWTALDAIKSCSFGNLKAFWIFHGDRPMEWRTNFLLWFICMYVNIYIYIHGYIYLYYHIMSLSSCTLIFLSLACFLESVWPRVFIYCLRSLVLK